MFWDPAKDNRSNPTTFWPKSTTMEGVSSSVLDRLNTVADFPVMRPSEFVTLPFVSSGRMRAALTMGEGGERTYWYQDGSAAAAAAAQNNVLKSTILSLCANWKFSRNNARGLVLVLFLQLGHFSSRLTWYGVSSPGLG